MNYFGEVITKPTALPITVSDAQADLAAAVTEEIERTVLWRAIVAQQRKITVDGPLPPRIEIEPVRGIVITQWTHSDAAAVIPASTYNVVTRDPAGTTIAPAPGYDWPAPEREIGSFELTYECGWEVEPESAPGAGDAINAVPPSVQLMISRAVAFREGSGLGDISIGSLKLSFLDSYSSDQLPKEIASLGRFYQYRPGIFAAKP